MAQYRQSGADRLAVRNPHDSAAAVAADQVHIRIPHKHHHRIRRPAKHLRRLSVSAVVIALSLALVITLLAVLYLSRRPQDLQTRSVDDDYQEFRLHGNHSLPQKELILGHGDFRLRGNHSLPQKELKFGHGSGVIGADSRYWDRDDRRRDHDYSEDDISHSKMDNSGEQESKVIRNEVTEKIDDKSRGMYNEGGRAELDSYKEEYEQSLKRNGQSLSGGSDTDEVNVDDEYDDGIDIQDEHVDTEHDEEEHAGDISLSLVNHEDKTRIADAGGSKKGGSSKSRGKESSGFARTSGGDSHTNRGGRLSTSEKKSGSKRKPKHHKVSGSSCEMKFLNSTAQLVEPLENKKFSRFSLQYTDVEERPNGLENWEPKFSGHQNLQEREMSFYARDQRINCGFIKGPRESPSTGFDLAEDDMKFMSSCHIAVSSCIFGNSDRLRSPFSKMITRQSKKNVCFVMFLDEITLKTLLAEGQKMNSGDFIGLWKIVLVKNLPYTDMRRVGKIPKFLTHRLFPSARYSIWLDSKLRLQTDPYLILEYFLWRRGYEYAISNHYDRHCVWEEVIQNKKLNKFNHTIIDQQFQFYQSDGLKKFDPSDPNKLLPSHVPEGSFIVRTHTPMSNLFSCLWFNEVDRFTPRDQLSFAYTYLKLTRMNPGKPFYLNMFKDCERRSMAKLFHHRAQEKRGIPTQVVR